MISKVFNRIKRAPISAMAVLLFAAVISIIICTLIASNEAEIRNYEEVYRNIPVKIKLTNVAGTDSDDLNIPIWVLNVFTGKKTVPVPLDEYVEDIQVKSSIVGKERNTKLSVDLLGLTSLSCDNSLLPENGCVITWYDGYDEGIFSGEEPVCIIPEALTMLDNGNGEIVIDFVQVVMSNRVEKERYEYQCTLKIAGIYTGGDGESIYCPFPIVEQVYNGLVKRELLFDSFSATLADNSRLEEFREKMTYWFVEPTLVAEDIPWGKMGYEFYPYALDIEDEVLQKTVKILQSSIRFNQTCTVIVFVLSAVAGFLVGFLMIRNRKRDITLMRTIGESDCRIYFGFAIEQMTCIFLGIIAGGAFHFWKPIDTLAAFALIYFIGLSLALVVFLRKNLLTTIKEDE